MQAEDKATWRILLYGSLLLLGGLTSAQEPAQAPDKKADMLPWLTSLADGYLQAQRRGQPILVRVGSESCVWCRKLEKELGEPALRQELGRWLLVSLDAGRLGKDARTLAVGPVPALRVLTPTGRLVASRDGFLPAERLVVWLKENHVKAAPPLADELIGELAPTPAVVERLVAMLNSRDPALREAAARRLLPHPLRAAPAVVDSLASGNLQSRLAALELLRDWRAPIDTLDPWRPESISAQRVEVLRKWAAHVQPPAPAPLGGAQLTAARRDLARLVQAPANEANPILERLARFGPALLPEIRAQLNNAGSDDARARLRAACYRLAANTALVLAWPGGVERLASGHPADRHEAMNELLRRATAAEESLLLALFSDPDLLLREWAVRGLIKIASPESPPALARLLADPEASVRGLVLKQLAERKSSAFVPALGDFLARETDPELAVPAVRILRELDSDSALACLKGLVQHESWEIRAEAAEALGHSIKRRISAGVVRESVYAVLCRALLDQDAFVVNRAVKALRLNAVPAHIGPLVQAAKDQPTVVVDVIDAICVNGEMRRQALPQLRQFCTHENPQARAAAAKELCAATSAVEQELRTAFRDREPVVRIAAANGLLEVLDSLRSDYPEAGDSATAAELDSVLNKDRAGKGRPAWTAQMPALLQPLLLAQAPEERLAAAAPLVALGQEEVALPVLLQAVKESPRLLASSAVVLPWLPAEKRLALCRQLLELGPSAAELIALARQLVRVYDPRVLPLLWEMAGRQDLTPQAAGYLVGCLRFVHFGMELNSENRRSITAGRRQETIAQARPRGALGPQLQRLIALAVLYPASSEEGLALAARILGDDKAADELRADALQLLFLGHPRSEATRLASAALEHPASAVRLRALTCLMFEIGSGELVRGALDLGIENLPRTAAWTPEPPRGLQAPAVRPLLADADPEIRARAGYLLALFNDPAGLQPLLAYWRGHGRDDETWARSVYRAVAVLGDDARVPILEEICRRYEAGVYRHVNDFYWTIRIMEGPNVLGLRKYMRQEFGLERLQ